MPHTGQTFINTVMQTSALAVIMTLTACSGGSDQPDTPPPGASNTPWLAGVNLARFQNCVRESGAILLQAHRAGDRPGFAENALSTMDASIADGAVFLEIDVARLSDGTLVLMHDDTVDRTTTGEGEVSDFTIESFKSLQLVDLNGEVLDEAPPTLAEALAHLEDRGIALLDLKNTTLSEISQALIEADAAHRSAIITDTLEDAIEIHQLLPETLLSVSIRSMDDIQTLSEAGFDLDYLQAWLGVGNGNPELDAQLAEIGVETSFGNFRAESDGTADYLAMNDAGAEVISVDNVSAAARTLNAAQMARGVLASCPEAQ